MIRDIIVKVLSTKNRLGLSAAATFVLTVLFVSADRRAGHKVDIFEPHALMVISSIFISTFIFLTALHLVTKYWDVLVQKFWAASPIARLIIVGSAFWILAVGAFFIVFEPRFMRSSDYTVFKVMFFPPVVLVAGYFTYKKLIQGHEKSRKDRA